MSAHLCVSAIMPGTGFLFKHRTSRKKGENDMFRKLALFGLIAILAVAAYGSAAALGVTGGTIQSGSDTDLTCTSAVYVAGWGLETDDDLVYSVRIGGIPGACFGNAMFVKVGPGDPIEVPAIDEAEESVNFPSPVPVQSITSLSIWIEGSAP